MMRTQDEIVTRIHARSGSDFFGFYTEVLLSALDFEHAKPWLKDDTTEEQWGTVPAEDDVRKAAVGYLDFAFDMADGHRGISASRSVDKMGAYLWLLGLDVDRFDAADYENYGVPKLFVAAEELGTPLPTDEGLARMSQGLRCSDDCWDGCGS